MLSIQVQSDAGTDFGDAIAEMYTFAATNGVCAVQTINGVITMVFPDDDPSEVTQRFTRSLEEGRKIIRRK